MPIAWPQRLQPATFRGRLTLWFSGLSLATLLCVGLYVGRIATDELADFGGQSLQTSARSAAMLLAITLREREREILLLSQLPELRRGNLRDPQLRQLLDQRVQTNPEYAWIGVTDAEGLVLQGTQGMLVGLKVDKRPWFQASLHGTYTGDVHEAVLLAKLLPQQTPDEPLRFVDFAAPIQDARGQLRGVIGAHAHWRWVTDTLESVVAQNAARRQTEMLIANREGKILYPYRLMGATRLPERARPGVPYELLNWEDGRTYLTSMVEVDARTSTDLGWRIVLRQPLEAAVEPLDVLHRQLLVFGLVATLIFALVAYRSATRMSRPIEQLAEAVRHIEARDQPPVYPDTKDEIAEIRQLSDSIQSMTGSLLQHERELETLNASLEQQVRERTDALSLANQELERLATVDALTGLNNRRHFDARLHECFQLLKRSGRGFGLLLIDADHFKRVNDQHGHQTGDQVLRQLAQVLTHSTRVTDFVARYGGEEFAVLLPELHEMTEVLTVAEKVRGAVAAATFPAVGRVTISVGVSCASESDPLAETVVARADRALYQAKEQGRNRVVPV